MDIKIPALQDQAAQNQYSAFMASVLEEADKHAESILQKAYAQREKTLEEARITCANLPNYEMRETDKNEESRDYQSLVLESKKQLFVFRKQLVDSLFADIEKKLEVFTESNEYEAWLKGCLTKFGDFSTGGESLSVTLRPQDKKYEGMIAAAAKGCKIIYGNNIRVGGLMVSDGKLLFDETLDKRLEDEKEKFCENTEFMVL